MLIVHYVRRSIVKYMVLKLSLLVKAAESRAPTAMDGNVRIPFPGTASERPQGYRPPQRRYSVPRATDTGAITNANARRLALGRLNTASNERPESGLTRRTRCRIGKVEDTLTVRSATHATSLRIDELVESNFTTVHGSALAYRGYIPTTVH